MPRGELVRFQSARVLVTSVRRGSIEFQAVIQVLAEFPWDNALEYAEMAGSIVKEIGAYGGGVVALKEAAKWLTRKLERSAAPIQPTEAKHELGDSINIGITSTIQTREAPIATSEDARLAFSSVLRDTKPGAVAAQIDSNAVPGLVRLLAHGDEQKDLPHIGGGTILTEWNLRANGVEDPKELAAGGPFVLHNHAALGLQRADHPDTVYAAATAKGSRLKLREVRLESYSGEVRQETPFRGGSIDLADLDEPGPAKE